MLRSVLQFEVFYSDCKCIREAFKKDCSGKKFLINHDYNTFRVKINIYYNFVCRLIDKHVKTSICKKTNLKVSKTGNKKSHLKL